MIIITNGCAIKYIKDIPFDGKTMDITEIRIPTQITGVVATFNNFDELEEILNNVELNDGYKIGINQSNGGDEITIYRYKD